VGAGVEDSVCEEVGRKRVGREGGDGRGGGHSIGLPSILLGREAGLKKGRSGEMGGKPASGFFPGRLAQGGSPPHTRSIDWNWPGPGISQSRPARGALSSCATPSTLMYYLSIHYCLPPSYGYFMGSPLSYLSPRYLPLLLSDTLFPQSILSRKNPSTDSHSNMSVPYM
jgi:hypothetical protein